MGKETLLIISNKIEIWSYFIVIWEKVNMPYKCILWGLGQDYNKYINLIRYHVLQNNIEIVGVTSNASSYKKVDNYPFFKKKELVSKNFDIIIVTSTNNIDDIRNEAKKIGIGEKQIIDCKIFDIPNLNLKLYFDILQSDLTIFANNCWGGYVYHRLGMKFLSPFIDMYFLDYDYLKFLENPKTYLDKKLVLKEMRYNNNTNSYYPICYCDDILLYFLHYNSFDDAERKWNKRKKRINWNNIFVMMYTEDIKIAKKFSKLSYKNKICFVPFEMKEESLYYINYKDEKEMSDKRFSEIVNGIAQGKYICYDILDLLNGKIHSSRLNIE